MYTYGHDDHIFEISTYSGAKYPKFQRRLARKTAYLYEVRGDCCWELYPERQFGGRWQETLLLGNGQHHESMQPHSMKKINCLT